MVGGRGRVDRRWAAAGTAERRRRRSPLTGRGRRSCACVTPLSPSPHYPLPLPPTPPRRVIPVSVIMSLLGVWASLYHMVDKWAFPEHGGSWGCNLIAH